MSTGNPLEQLRRRMQSQATPTAFAALAEEHRRAGRFAEAIAVCREGLERYPAYASARVTLGRALLDSGDARTAVAELEQAVAHSPDNLAAAKALEAAHRACDALPPLASVAAIDDLDIRLADADSASIPGDLMSRALGSAADCPQEFGLAPDWSIPSLPRMGSAAAPDDAVTDSTDTLALYAHAESPTIGFTAPHLQGEEPAGIWPVPSSMTAPRGDASTDGARVYSWAILPPTGPGDARGDHPAPDCPPPISVWDAPTIEAPLVDLVVLSAPPASGLDVASSPDHIDALSGFGSECDVEPSATLAVADAAPAAGLDESSSFWDGPFGGEAASDAPSSFAGWGAEPPATADGADRSPWTHEGTTHQTGAWTVPDGPSATWALGDLHEAAGADLTPFRELPDDAPAVSTPFGSLTAPGATSPGEVVPAEAAPAEAGWAGSVKSALGEVFAHAGHGESLEPPAHRSPAVREAMADAALAATLEDTAMRHDTVPPALASLQQMLDAVRARRAALFSHPDA